MLFRKKYINKVSKKKYKIKEKKNKPINKKRKNEHKYLKDIIEKRYFIITIIIIVLFLIIGVRLFYLQILNNNKYIEKLAIAVENTVEGTSSPRGRIYDRNHKLMVDNTAVKTIYYKKSKNITSKEEIKLAYKVSEMLDIDYSKLDNHSIKNFWYLNNINKAKKKITKKEWQKNKERKISDDEIEDMIFDRITEEDLSVYNEIDKEAAYIYYLMNKGYYHSEKLIKNKNVTEEEYALISENIDNLKGFNTKLDWERVYLYDDVFKTILGSVSSDTQGIPEELASFYLDNGYTLEDRVGISYLEYQYEKYLKGTKAVYKVNNDNSYEMISEGTRGNDIVLTIDIELQKYLEDVLTQEVLNTKNENNTDYYNRSFAIISDPSSGEILAMAGKQVKTRENGTRYVVDYTPGVVTSPVTPGSVVKGASTLVGYKYGAIDIGTKQVDECIKIKATPEKCSWKTMGLIDDIYALQYSSNVYQFKIAINVGGGKYEYDKSLSIDESAFDKYRSMYKSFGLGIKTGIDLPVESIGYKGSSKMPGHLLDFSIGQYDNYTPIQLTQYINTLANEGLRLQPHLLKEVYMPSKNKKSTLGDKVYEYKPKKLGTVDADAKFIDRVQEGFKAVVERGLGVGYMGSYTDSAGKTGTSQSFIDTDGDGIVDTETTTTSFVGYSPSENPKMSIVVVSPDVSYSNSNIDYTSSVNRRISSQIVNKFFEIYK